MKIGFLDDDYDVFESAKSSFTDYKIELIKLDSIDNVSDYEKIVNVIFFHNLDAIFIDYNLRKLTTENGTIVVKNLIDLLPDFPIFLITNFIDDGAEDLIVPKNDILKKEIFEEDDDSETFKEFIENIKNRIDCYKHKIKINEDQYLLLLEKRRNKTLSEEDNNKFIKLYKILEIYRKVDPLPKELLDNKFEVLMTQLNDALSDFSNELKSQKHE